MKYETSKGRKLLEKLDDDAGRTYSATHGNKRVTIQTIQTGLEVVDAKRSHRSTLIPFSAIKSWNADDDGDTLVLKKHQGGDDIFKLADKGHGFPSRIADAMTFMATALASAKRDEEGRQIDSEMDDLDAGATLAVLVKCSLRVGFQLDSEQCGALAKGTLIEVEEVRVLFRQLH